MVQGAVGDGFLSGSVGEPVSKGCGRTARDNHTYSTSIKTETLTVLITMCPTDLPKFDFIFIFYSSYKLCSVYNLYLTNR